MPPKRAPSTGASKITAAGGRRAPSASRGHAREQKRDNPVSQVAQAPETAAEVFARYEPEGRGAAPEGALRLQDFDQCVRDVNVSKGLIWGVEVATIVKQEWVRSDGNKDGKVSWASFEAWWPQFLQRCELRREGATLDGAVTAKDQGEEGEEDKGVWNVRLEELGRAMRRARDKGKTPFLLDSSEGHAAQAVVTGAASSSVVVDCAQMAVNAAQGMDVEEILATERDRFFAGHCFKYGKTLVFHLGSSADADMTGTFSTETFPSAALMDAREVAAVQGMGNARKFLDSPFSKMCPDQGSLFEFKAMGVDEKFNVVVVSNLAEGSYEELLKDKIPLHLLQPITVKAGGD